MIVVSAILTIGVGFEFEGSYRGAKQGPFSISAFAFSFPYLLSPGISQKHYGP
jgi:hypothetical protein